MTTETIDRQAMTVAAIAPVLPAYSMSSDEWMETCIMLRHLSRGEDSAGASFIEDVARAADAMHHRLVGAQNYVGKAELDAALEPSPSAT